MTWAAFQRRQQELRLQFREAKQRSCAIEVAAIDQAMDQHCAAHRRFYRISEGVEVNVICDSGVQPFIDVARVQADGLIHIFDPSRMTPLEIRRLADVKETIDAYVAGKLDELPPDCATWVTWQGCPR